MVPDDTFCATIGSFERLCLTGQDVFRRREMRDGNQTISLSMGSAYLRDTSMNCGRGACGGYAPDWPYNVRLVVEFPVGVSLPYTMRAGDVFCERCWQREMWCCERGLNGERMCIGGVCSFGNMLGTEIIGVIEELTPDRVVGYFEGEMVPMGCDALRCLSTPPAPMPIRAEFNLPF